MKSKYIPNNRLCIHLDQFAISDIVQQTNEQWNTIGELLKEGVKKNVFFALTLLFIFLKIIESMMNYQLNKMNY